LLISNLTKQELKQLIKSELEQVFSYTLIGLSRVLYKNLLNQGYTMDDDFMCTYQYDLRWCLQSLRNDGITSYRKIDGVNHHFLLS
jgi:hypothetical protein